MQVSIIIVTWNDYVNTAKCISSVIEHTNGVQYEIILVDNGSTKVDAYRFKKKFPKIKLVVSERNGGFSYGNNVGLQVAKGWVILLLNNDTILHENSVKKAFDFMTADGRIGVVGCRMVYPGRKHRVQYSARRFRSVRWELLDIFRFIPYLLPYGWRADLMLGRYFRHDETRECDWVTAAFMMFPHYLIKFMPGQKLDERFHMSAEDQLWCEQIKAMGEYKVMFFAGTTITHICGASGVTSRNHNFRKNMRKNEREVMRLRKGDGIYYRMWNAIYSAMDIGRTLVKKAVLSVSGKFIE